MIAGVLLNNPNDDKERECAFKPSVYQLLNLLMIKYLETLALFRMSMSYFMNPKLLYELEHISVCLWCARKRFIFS